MLALSKLLFKCFSQVWSKELLHLGQKNQSHIQLILLYNIRSYIELYFFTHEDIIYYFIFIRYKCFCLLFHQVIYPHFIMIKIYTRTQCHTIYHKTCLCLQFGLEVMTRNSYLWQLLYYQIKGMWSIHNNFRIIMLWNICCCNSILCLKITLYEMA